MCHMILIRMNVYKHLAPLTRNLETAIFIDLYLNDTVLCIWYMTGIKMTNYEHK